jgi:hypothetical protein
MATFKLRKRAFVSRRGWKWMNTERLLIGWKEIMAAFRVHSLNAMKKKVKNMPFR